MIESSDNTSYGNNEAVSPNANTQDESSDDSISATVELDGEDKVAGVNGNAQDDDEVVDMTIELNGDEETTDATVNAHNDGSDESIDIGVSIGV